MLACCCVCFVYRAQVPGNRKGYYVGKYEVLLNSFEQVALPTFSDPNDKSDKAQQIQHLQVIDEIGKMELFSRDFVQSVQRTFQSPHRVVLATIPISKGKSHWILEELRSRKDVQIFEVCYQFFATPSSLNYRKVGLLSTCAYNFQRKLCKNHTICYA